MPYRLEPNEPVAAGLKRVVAEKFAWAVDHLSGKQKTGRDAAIHETRKSIKKIRAVLRLVSCQIGDPWRAENNRLRKVAHTLAEFRDAAVMIHTFDELKREFRDDGWPRTLSSVRSAFRQKADSETRREITRILKATIPVLRKTAADAQAWPLGGDGFAVLEPGLEKAYRRSRKALARARNSAFPEVWHEYRKRVKDHWYHVRLLGDLGTATMAEYEKDLKQLETLLGDDHNLVVLHDRIAADSASYGTEKDIRFLVDHIGVYQKKLRHGARSLSDGIYAEKPRRYVRRVRGLWESWRKEHCAGSIQQ